LNKSQIPKVERAIFGHLPDGTAIEMIRLHGDDGFEVRLITYGAAIQSILAPDRAGRVADVVLGRDDLAGYVEFRRFLGATVGRYANRIASGAFELDGKRFQLATNDGANALHGGLAASIANSGLSRTSVKIPRLSSRYPMSVRTARKAIPAGWKRMSPTAFRVALSFRSRSPR
jgi:Aldose 1-epimerase